MIELVGSLRDETIDAIRALLLKAEWEVTDTDERRYAVWHGVVAKLAGIDELNFVFPRMHQAFFLSIPPGGFVHRHRDTDDVYRSFHVPVTSNEYCEVFEHKPDGVVFSHRPMVGAVYSFDRTIEHSSVNCGSAERTHLIVEVLK